MLCPGVHADDFKIWSIPSIDFGTWSNAGTLTSSVTGCIVSEEKRNKKDDYRLELKGESSGGVFYLYLNGNDSLTGNERIAIEISARDLFSSPGYEPLNPDDETSRREGQLKNCPDGDNGELRFVLRQGDLASAAGGRYSAEFELTGEGGKRFSEDDDTGFSVYVEVQNPQVRISGLDDLNLVTDPQSASGLTFDESFCVYSSQTDYRITMTSSTYGPDGGFSLAGPSGPDIPVSFLFTDNNFATGLQTVQPGVSLAGAGSSASNSCDGTDNATLRLQVDEQAIREARTGSYGSTVTFYVEPI